MELIETRPIARLASAVRRRMATNEGQISPRISFCAMALFCAAVLLPQGVGLRLAPLLPNLDLPRIAMLGMFGLLLFQATKFGFSIFSQAPRTLWLLATLSIWQFFSAAASSSPKWAVVWAIGNLIAYWGFAFAMIVLVGGRAQRKLVVSVLVLLGIALALWSSLEFLTQGKLVPERNIYFGAEQVLFSTGLRRLVFVNGVQIDTPLMSIGPYAINLILAAALCALGGFLLIRRRWPIVVYGLLVGLLVFSVLSTQSRAGVIALAVMLLLAFIWAGSGVERLCIFLSFSIASAAFILFFGPSEFYFSFLHHFVGAIPWLGGGMGGVTGDVSNGEMLPLAAGSLEGRWHGLKTLVPQIADVWFLGHGPGSVFDSQRVVTSLALYSDTGSFFCFFVELGVIGGLILALLVFASMIQGFGSRNAEIRAATLGLVGFSVTALSSLTPWVWGVGLVMAGLIESWSRADGSATRLGGFSHWGKSETAELQAKVRGKDANS